MVIFFPSNSNDETNEKKGRKEEKGDKQNMKYCK